MAKILEMSDPGCIEIYRVVRSYKVKAVSFPRTYLEKGSLDFSFSDLDFKVRQVTNYCSSAWLWAYATVVFVFNNDFVCFTVY